MTGNQMSIRPTLVRRVSDLFKEGSNSRSPLLFNHSSMEKLRHCCQNLNLFPYLLYSLGNAKSNQLNASQLLTIITERIFLLYFNIRQYAPGIFRFEEKYKNIQLECQKNNTTKIASKFSKFQLPKRKGNSLFLILAVYLAPFVLAFQLIGILSLMVFGNPTPGFLFLFCALIFLGYISMKILTQDTSSQGRKKFSKRKLE